ncbi:MAG: cysteine desulfurase-like protein [Bacteroidetes bacterium]|nr:MAG: cysteine desulfurase-like protein [Bacteroidota bacterium]
MNAPPPTQELDMAFVRSHFPALQQQWIYMDNAGGSQTLKTVADRISDYLLNTNVQVGGSYEISQLSMQRIAAGSAAMATLINAAHPQEVVMGPSTSMMMRILSLSMGRMLQPGDEIIVSNADHEANVSPWMDLQRQGIKVHIWKINPQSFRLELDQLEQLMNARTRLVTVTHTSNVLGILNPIKEIAQFVHQRNAWICVDGVAHAPHCLIDVQELDVDFYGFSFYKVYGPHYALLYGKREHLLRLPGVNHYFIDGPEIPYKFQPGNVNFEFAYGMLGLTDYLQAVARHHFPGEQGSMRQQLQRAFELFAQQEARLNQRLLHWLNSRPNVRIIGERSAHRNLRVPTISFVVEGRDSREIVEQVDPHKIGIRYGDFYAKKLIHDLGLEAQNGVIRVSLVHYNTLEEVDRLIEVLEGLI